MAETMEQYMSKTRVDYRSGVARPKIKDKDNFELKGKFLKELRTNTFSGSDHEDANEHIKKVLEIVDLFHIPNITIDLELSSTLDRSSSCSDTTYSSEQISSLCEICSDPHDTQYCMENPKQAFVDYASSCNDEARDARLSKFEADFKQQQSEMTNKIDTVLKAITDRMAGALPSNMVKNPKMNINSTTSVLSAQENEEKENISREDINNNSSTPLDPSVSFITEKVLKFNSFFESLGLTPQLSGTKVVCTKGDDGDVMFIEIVKKNDNSRKEEPEAGGLGMHVFIGNFTYVMDFMIVEDISSIINPRLSQVVLGKSFIEISNMTHDPPEGVVRFTNGSDEIAYKMTYKIEQYNSLSDLEKEHTKSVYLRNEKDKRRGVEIEQYFQVQDYALWDVIENENSFKPALEDCMSAGYLSTANTQVNPASTQVSTANLSDDAVYAFLANQPNGSQLVYEDLKQIHEYAIEEMDLKW
ncbi:hypothetical protein Tco_0626303 [Tanacetum coccineum]|uniref:Protein kinase-like domain, concanavalin A-like lectin/glucanase domain protein n=1 Tax=Tanacetum coccineum TaxID=301880 RepID=A0ABQ4WJ97_9ASTR